MRRRARSVAALAVLLACAIACGGGRRGLSGQRMAAVDACLKAFDQPWVGPVIAACPAAQNVGDAPASPPGGDWAPPDDWAALERIGRWLLAERDRASDAQRDTIDAGMTRSCIRLGLPAERPPLYRLPPDRAGNGRDDLPVDGFAVLGEPMHHGTWPRAMFAATGVAVAGGPAVFPGRAASSDRLGRATDDWSIDAEFCRRPPPEDEDEDLAMDEDHGAGAMVNYAEGVLGERGAYFPKGRPLASERGMDRGLPSIVLLLFADAAAPAAEVAGAVAAANGAYLAVAGHGRAQVHRVALLPARGIRKPDDRLLEIQLEGTATTTDLVAQLDRAAASGYEAVLLR